MRGRQGAQSKLFDTAFHLPNGFIYKPEFITLKEEEAMLEALRKLPLKAARFREWTAKRRVTGFGWGYDYEKEMLIPGPPLPPFLESFQRKIAKWLDIPPRRVVEALVNEYSPGTPIGFHRDNEKFDKIIGISLSGWCAMRLRPIPGEAAGAAVSVELEPRSAYILQGEVRWKWQHAIPPTKTLRYSLTFRTLPR